ncbi:protein-L-isoaspartate(D-aspartate) O-methyltransferase [Candidatus Margulisiibacteriota bacterium]
MNYKEQRRKMVEIQLKARGISNPDVIQAFLDVPREAFVPHDLTEQAYDDCPLPIGDEQTISQPYMVALMSELVQPKKEAKLLDIGTGSGYQAAILSKLCAKVVTMERIFSLSKKAQERLKKYGYKNIMFVPGDGSQGYREDQPYDGIIVAAASPDIPHPLIDQLTVGARLIIPVGDIWGQYLKVVTKTKDGFKVDTSVACSFVPLVGRLGY